MAADEVVDLDDPKCSYCRLGYGARLSLHKVGVSKYVLTDTLVGCNSTTLEATWSWLQMESWPQPSTFTHMI